MEHRKLSALLSPSEKIAKVAAQGAKVSKGSQTSPSGAKSFDNADGTRTIIGEVQNGEGNPSYTMATHVGDETPPGVPTGITASCKSGVVVVEWDGTLDGGIPDDFYCVRIYLDGTELGALTEAGSVSSASLEAETVHAVTATSEDDCCLPDGTPAHNVSDPTTAVSVTVSQDAAGVAEIANQALTIAEATGQHFWPDDDGIHVTEVTEEEWKDSSGQHYHSGMNVLINSLGQLFRNGLNNLMALLPSPDEFTPSRIAFYDGNGNAEENIIALIEPDEVQLVRQVSDVAVSTGSVSLLGDKVYVYGQNNPSTGETVGQLVTVNNTVQNWNTYGATISKTREGSSSSYDWATCEQALRAYIHDGQNATYSEMGVSSGAGLFTTTNAFIRSPVLDLATSAAGEAGTVSYATEMLELINELRTATKTFTLTNLGGAPQLTLTRRGHWVLAQMNNVVNPSSANTNISCGTVPTGYRPTKDAFYSGVGAISTTLGGFFRWRVATSGAITFICSATGNRECQLLAYWYTDDAWPTS